MAEKKHMYESNVMALPPLRLVLGDVPSPDPEGRRRLLKYQQPNHEIETTVKKLIAHLKEDQK
ncbi:MAG: hypothetical protein HY781_12670 [Chloroflexi bacterium]|nr:hypothetical protein [Chloroflexota bacterium]